MNLQELRNAVYSTLGERPEDDYFSDDEINRWLNEGQKKAVLDSECLQETATTTTDDSTVELPDDFIKEFKVLRNGDEIPRVPFEERENKDGYYLWEGYLNLTYDSGEVKMYYLKEPTSMTGDLTEPEIPEFYHDVLIDYAVYRARQKDKQFDMAEVSKRDFREGVNRLRQRYGRKPARTQWKVERL